MPNSSSKPGCELGKCGVLDIQIVLETQGDRFCSVKPLVKITSGFF
jgi:hypothetical protein